MKTKILVSTIALVAICAAPVVAGTLYLPLAAEQSIDGEHHRTLLWATNPSSSAKTFSVRFIPTGSAGTGGEADASHVVPPGATVPIAAVDAGVGMLEVTGPDELAFIGELNTFGPTGQLIHSTEIPLVGLRNMLASGETAHLLALEREIAGSRTDLGIDNLGTAEASCTIRTFRADGSQILSTVTLTVPALGQRFFPDAFGILSEPSIDGGRFEVSCNQSFFAWAAVFGEFPDFSKFVVPSSGGLPTTGAPDPNPNDPVPNPGEQVVVRRPGQFFAGRNGASKVEIAIPTPEGEYYSRGVIEMDVQTGVINKVFTTVVGLLRPNPNRALYFGHFVRGENKHGLVQKTILDVDHEVSHDGANGVWLRNASYHVRFVYDTVGRNIELTVTRGGLVVERLTGRITNLDLGHDGQGMKLIFGIDGVAADAYYPPIGWTFSNLVATFTP